MKAHRIRRLILGAVLILGIIAPAAGGYVFFHRELGDWAVLCWRDIHSQKQFCRLSAPRPSLSYRLAPNVIEIREWKPDAFQVVVMVRDRVDAELPLSLRIDRQPIHEIPVRESMAWWSGATAERIIAEMRAGRKLIIRVQTFPDGMPRDVKISLAGFGPAFDAYRGALRIHNIFGP